MSFETHAIVVSFNSVDDLRRNLPAVLRSTDRVVVVDNGNTDGSAALAQKLGATVVEAASNLGYGAAANLGVRTTMPAPQDVVIILNPDVSLTRDTADRLARRARLPRVGAVAPSMVDGRGAPLRVGRPFPSIGGLLARHLRMASGVPSLQTSADHGSNFVVDRRHGLVVTDWVLGACMAMRFSVFEAVGGFDPSYFLYFEDVDLCLRLRRSSGLCTSIATDCEVVHDYGRASRSLTRVDIPVVRYHWKSFFRYVRRHPRLALGLTSAHRQLSSVPNVVVDLNALESPSTANDYVA